MNVKGIVKGGKGYRKGGFGQTGWVPEKTKRVGGVKFKPAGYVPKSPTWHGINYAEPGKLMHGGLTGYPNTWQEMLDLYNQHMAPGINYGYRTPQYGGSWTRTVIHHDGLIYNSIKHKHFLQTILKSPIKHMPALTSQLDIHCPTCAKQPNLVFDINFDAGVAATLWPDVATSMNWLPTTNPQKPRSFTCLNCFSVGIIEDNQVPDVLWASVPVAQRFQVLLWYQRAQVTLEADIPNRRTA